MASAPQGPGGAGHGRRGDRIAPPLTAQSAPPFPHGAAREASSHWPTWQPPPLPSSRPISRSHRGPAAGRAPIKLWPGRFCNCCPPRAHHGGAAVAAGPEPRAAAPRPPPQRPACLDRAPPQDRAAPAPARRSGECAVRSCRGPAGGPCAQPGWVGGAGGRAGSPRGSGGSCRGALAGSGTGTCPPPFRGMSWSRLRQPRLGCAGAILGTGLCPVND